MQSFEICTQIGCCVKCLKYCPQELIEAQYKGIRILTLTEFKNLISTIPTDVLLVFSGISEPFQNQECTDMILYAHQQGYTIRVFSTLVGLKPKNATSILDIPFERFILHLPDAEGNAKIPITSDYLELLGQVLTHIHNLEFMNMGSSFVSFKQEDVFRNKPVTRKNYLLPQCANLRTPNYMVLPNGDVYFCCQTKGLTGKVGSLYKSSYQELTDPTKFKKQAKQLQTTLCRMCVWSEPAWWYAVQKLKIWLLGTKRLKEYLV